MAFLSTGCSSIDKLFPSDPESTQAGGLPSKTVSGIFGPPDLGKTWFGVQCAVMSNREEKVGGLNAPALIIETEGMFGREEALERIVGYYKKRWSIEKDITIDIHPARDLYSLMSLFGYSFNLETSGKAKISTKITGIEKTKITSALSLIVSQILSKSQFQAKHKIYLQGL